MAAAAGVVAVVAVAVVAVVTVVAVVAVVAMVTVVSIPRRYIRREPHFHSGEEITLEGADVHVL